MAQNDQKADLLAILTAGREFQSLPEASGKSRHGPMTLLPAARKRREGFLTLSVKAEVEITRQSGVQPPAPCRRQNAKAASPDPGSGDEQGCQDGPRGSNDQGKPLSKPRWGVSASRKPHVSLAREHASPGLVGDDVRSPAHASLRRCLQPSSLPPFGSRVRSPHQTGGG